ncbi:hypothetical protein ANCCAN_20847 [Ancylostoma caninum]|uniref:Uncharacterized protein n=1 Tax=Ancylostoma caninum TaxID=29170 RepID=A0A368FMP6_ANCCA|nr:hypothetical protein ANCCAN_20847 [Ancylostoma caninum]
MKVLVFVLLLQLTEIASQCPATGEITKNELDRALFVAKIQVDGELPRDKHFFLYNIHYSDFYFSYHDLAYTKRKAPTTVALSSRCPPLVKGKTYILGCWKYDKHRCDRMVREFDKLTEGEKQLIRSMKTSAYYYYLDGKEL